MSSSDYDIGDGGGDVENGANDISNNNHDHDSLRKKRRDLSAEDVNSTNFLLISTITTMKVESYYMHVQLKDVE